MDTSLCLILIDYLLLPRRVLRLKCTFWIPLFIIKFSFFVYVGDSNLRVDFLAYLFADLLCAVMCVLVWFLVLFIYALSVVCVLVVSASPA